MITKWVVFKQWTCHAEWVNLVETAVTCTCMSLVGGNVSDGSNIVGSLMETCQSIVLTPTDLHVWLYIVIVDETPNCEIQSPKRAWLSPMWDGQWRWEDKTGLLKELVDQQFQMWVLSNLASGVANGCIIGLGLLTL